MWWLGGGGREGGGGACGVRCWCEGAWAVAATAAAVCSALLNTKKQFPTLLHRAPHTLYPSPAHPVP